MKVRKMNSEDLEKNDVKYITALGSVAHTYGNLLATAQKWLLDVFPDNLFKTVHVNSRIAHSQIVRTPHQFLKKSKPMIIFSPRIDYNEDTFMNKTLVTERMGGIYTTGTPGAVDLNPFFFDPEAHIDLQFTSQRRVMYIDVVLSFDTMIQQLNYMDYLKQTFTMDCPFDIDTWLEAFLPREIMDMIGTISGVPVHDPVDKSINRFLSYMNGHSCYPVTYKLAGSTGKEEFYRYYNTKIFTTITGLEHNQGESVGHIMTNYTINFTMRMEFWSPGTLYLFSNKVFEIPKPDIPTDSTLIPVFADVFMLEDLNLTPGWKVYTHASYTLDKPNDTIDFSPLMQKSIREVIKYQVQNAIPLINFLDIKVRRLGKLLRYGVDYEIDYANYTIQFHNKEPLFYTHTVIISIDVQYINELIKQIYHLE